MKTVTTTYTCDECKAELTDELRITVTFPDQVEEHYCGNACLRSAKS